ncbi:hypothetical protein SASPL_148710 [Salvia splendens]|uniref:Uncharacterized protein n=1 Tax=Salvia splendens TaxID=180675 RepID=A0A8X8WAT3_SALSN|nr:hypothetical protein SASPL_148710 [Salvia splendens]
MKGEGIPTQGREAGRSEKEILKNGREAQVTEQVQIGGEPSGVERKEIQLPRRRGCEKAGSLLPPRTDDEWITIFDGSSATTVSHSCVTHGGTLDMRTRYVGQDKKLMSIQFDLETFTHCQDTYIRKIEDSLALLINASLTRKHD